MNFGYLHNPDVKIMMAPRLVHIMQKDVNLQRKFGSFPHRIALGLMASFQIAYPSLYIFENKRRSFYHCQFRKV